MIQPQYLNQVVSSFVLWLDHKLCSNGAYTNYSGSFYPIKSPFSNYYSYGAVGAQLIADNSVSGANILSGVYLNNIFITTGTSGLRDIDYKHGFVYFNNNVNSYPISGYYSVKDFNILLTDKRDNVLLFKTKYDLRSKIIQNPTGISSDSITYPVVFVRLDGINYEPYAFGGSEWETINLKCLILADNLWNMQAVQSILSDSIRTPIALFSSQDMPFNSLGGLKSGIYNYTGMATSRINDNNYVFIERVGVQNLGQRLPLQDDNLNYDVYFNYVDFELSKMRDIR